MNEHDSRFIEHALALARKGVGLASPNPTVGCVIVRDGQIVGEGFHQYDRRDHAEIAALHSAGEKARGSTVYVTLEPCNHQGRTGPCTEALISAGVGRVVAAMADPNPRNNGRGFARLRQAGVEVESGLCENEAQRLNEGFSYWIRTGWPCVTLKSALTLDGQLAMPRQKRGRRGEWITSEESRAEVHRMRHASDALLTGIGTILADDPLLTDRSGLPRRRRLLRAVLDSRLRLPPGSRIVKTTDSDLVVFTSVGANSAKARRLLDAGVEVVSLAGRSRSSFLRAALQELGRRDVLSVLLEAGPTLNGVALSSRSVQKLVLFLAPKLATATALPFAKAGTGKLPALRIVRTTPFGPDVALEAYFEELW